jgi:hypothetical protein
MSLQRVSGANAPYRLRANKGIERNLFIELLKVIDGATVVDLTNYRYVGFAAASLEDFKSFHFELGIIDMHSIEMDKFAITRQNFNNPFHFILPHEKTSTKYIVEDYKSGFSHVVWLDYVNVDFKQQFQDLELIAAKMQSLDILKVSFNAQSINFIQSNSITSSADPEKLASDNDWKAILRFLKDHVAYQYYIPSRVKTKDIKNFSDLIRAMAIRAIKRGLAKNPNNNLKFNHVSAFDYADGQKMTTMTGVIAPARTFGNLTRQSKLSSWPFYKRETRGSELIEAKVIVVPDMTVSERILIEKKLPSVDIQQTAIDLPFKYAKPSHHETLIEGYQTFYKYLPYYGKVTY